MIDKQQQRAGQSSRVDARGAGAACAIRLAQPPDRPARAAAVPVVEARGPALAPQPAPGPAAAPTPAEPRPPDPPGQPSQRPAREFLRQHSQVSTILTNHDFVKPIDDVSRLLKRMSKKKPAGLLLIDKPKF